MKNIYESPKMKWTAMNIQNVVMQASLPIGEGTVDDQWSKEQASDDDGFVGRHSVWED